MEKPRLPSTPSVLRATLSVAIAAACTTMPAHAQFGGLLQSVLQQAMQAQDRESAAASVKAANEAPTKKWGQASPVPPELLNEAQVFAAKTGASELKPLLERLYIEGERNATLNLQRIGMAALAMGNVDLAEKAFEGAVYRIDLIYADNVEAQKAKTLWTAEKIKDFKGEPYERAMAFFYRGLIYIAKGDFQNARAMFKQADYQDTVAESEQYAGDFSLMPYMAGWASYCDGNTLLANEFLQQAAKGDKNYASVSVDQPVLVLFESGRVPFKYSGGKAGEVLKWQPHTLPTQIPTAACIGSSTTNCTIQGFFAGADIGFQATTRGGRPIDGVMGGKASFKEGAESVSSAAGTLGQIGVQTSLLTGSRNAGNLGMLGMFASLVATGVANATEAQADIREWEQLPATVWLGTGAKKESAVTLNVAFQTEGNVSYRPVSRLGEASTCQLYWGRSVAPMAPELDAGPIEPGVHKRDPVFREELAKLLAPPN